MNTPAPDQLPLTCSSNEEEEEETDSSIMGAPFGIGAATGFAVSVITGFCFASSGRGRRKKVESRKVVAVAYAIMVTRSINLNWKMRAVRVLPMFVLPALSSAIYLTLVSLTRMRNHKDQKALERLCAERQAGVDELKEKTNYYITQQLIQKYDPDPAAKAAAARVLASKLGTESGLKVHLEDESNFTVPHGKSNDAELVQSRGLQNRKQSLAKHGSTRNSEMQLLVKEMSSNDGHDDNPKLSTDDQAVIVENHPRSVVNEGGWFARIAALLVGEDPTQCYALKAGIEDLRKKLEQGLVPDAELKKLIRIQLGKRLQWGYKPTYEEQLAQVLELANSAVREWKLKYPT
ncbi:hypothetical protein ACLOJK_030154 [Asimina triloba]